MNVGNVSQNFDLFKDSIETKEYEFNVGYNSLKIQISSTNENAIVDITVLGRTSKEARYESLMGFLDSQYKLKSKIDMLGIFSYDVLGYEEVKIIVNSTDSPISCHIVEVKE